MFVAGAVWESSRVLATEDVRLAGDDELLAGVLAVQRAESLLAAAKGHLLAELDARGVCDAEFGLGTAAWVAREAGTSGAAVRRDLLLAR